MEPILILLIVFVVLAVIGGAAFVSTRPRGVDLELEPSGGTDTAVLDRPDVDEAVLDDVLVEPEVVVPEVVEPEPLVKPSFFDRLGKARSTFTGYLGGLVGLGKVDDAAWKDLEEALIRADVGVQTSMSLIEDVRDTAKETDAEEGVQVLELLKERMRAEIADKDRSLTIDDGQTNVSKVRAARSSMPTAPATDEVRESQLSLKPTTDSVVECGAAVQKREAD